MSKAQSWTNNTRGLLQPVPIPRGIWEDIYMDFIDGLSSSQGKTNILVVIDRFSKYAYFIALSHSYISTEVAGLFFNIVFKLHGLPRSIACNIDLVFTCSF